MQFATISAAALAFAVSAFAQTAGFDAISAPAKAEVVPAGSDYTIVWAPDTKYTGATITISLLGGKDSGTLNVVSTLATKVESDAGSYAWSVDKSLGADATYGIQITLEDDTSVFQWGFPFQISTSSSGYSTTAISTATSTSATSSATKTVTLSSSSETSAATVTTATTFPASTASSNLSTTAAGGATTTLTTTTTSASATKSTTTSVTVPTGAAPRAAAGSVALFGGIAAALFAM